MANTKDIDRKVENALRDVKFEPYWLTDPNQPKAEPPLSNDTACDLLVVGAGFCGLWAALQAKEADPQREVVLIEAKEVANGATGRPGGIMSTSLMHGIDNTVRMFPDEVATLERLGMGNMDGFKATIEKYSIDCDVEWNGELTVAIGEHELSTIQYEHDLFVKYGHDVVILSKDAVQREIASPLFSGGHWLKSLSGTIHPAKLAWGLKRVCKDLGVRIYENSPLQKTKETENGIEVQTPKGTITARKVLLATNGFAAGHRKIKQRVVSIIDRVVVTKPLTDEQMARVGWQNRQGVYDTRTQLNYMRLTADNRILFGGRLGYHYGYKVDPNSDIEVKPYRQLVTSFFKTFPMLSDVDIAYAWSGPIGLTTRMAVHYQRYYQGNMVYAGGYSGFGVTTARFGARVGLDILDGKDTPESKMIFARTLPSYVPPEPLRWLGFNITMYALDTMDEKGGWRVPWVRMVEKLGFPITMHSQSK